MKASIPALYECLKYSVKPPNLGDAKSYARFLHETKNLRLFNTFGTFRGHFKLTEKGIKKCSICKTPLIYLFQISKEESLRYRQLLKGPPLDIYGYFHNVGIPETLALLRHKGTGRIGEITFVSENDKEVLNEWHQTETPATAEI